MKKIYPILILVAALICCLMSCSKEEVSIWTDKGRVWFSSSDTLRFTFAQHEGVDSYVIKLPLTIAGNTAGNDRAFNVSVSSAARNSNTKYEIQTPTVIQKDSTSGYLNVLVYKTTNLETASDTVTFKLIDSDQLVTGLDAQLEKTIVISSHYVKPDWWGRYTEWELGRYTEKKIAIVDMLIGLENIKGGPYDGLDGENDWTIWEYKLRKYIKDNGPLYDDDGMEIRFEYGY